MGLPAWEAALALTKAKSVNATIPAQQQGDSKTPEHPSGPAIRKIKGDGAAGVPPCRNRGLQRRYPLDPTESGSENSAFVTRTTPAMGIGVSFPVSDSGVKVEYLVDHKLWSEYGASE